MLDAIHAGAVVVSEHATGLAPLEPGTHLLVAAADALPYVADHLLSDPDRLAQLREQAYERLSTWIPYALPVSILRAAIVELVGEALPDATRCSRSPAPDPRAARRPPADPPRPDCRADALGAGTATRVRGRAGRRRRRQPGLGRASGAAGERGLRGADADAAAPTATLDSLAAARLRELELIVVHPAGGAARARGRGLVPGPSAAAPRGGSRCAVRRVWVAARRAGALVARALFALRARARQRPVPAGPGRARGHAGRDRRRRARLSDPCLGRRGQRRLRCSTRPVTRSARRCWCALRRCWPRPTETTRRSRPRR